MKANLTEIWQTSNSRMNLLKRSLLFSILLSLLAFIKLNAQHVNLVFDPSTTNTTVGQNIVVDVSAQFTAALPIDAVQISLNFDATRLQVTGVTNVSTLTSIIGPSFDNTLGTINFVGAKLGAPFPAATFDVLSISFTVLTVPGAANLTFNRPPTEVANGGASVLGTTTNGVVNITGVGCTPPTATISAAPTCDANAFNLILAAAPAPTGTSPFDLTITGPAGTATYNDIVAGGVITNFTPPTERIWPAAPPLPPTSEDIPGITLGLRFQSSVAGFVKGVRFFSPDEVPIPAGNFTGQLWTETGTLLASGTFTGVTVSTWNELLFANPILITAGTTYVASFHTNATKYVGTANGLLAPVVNGSLTALAGGGVYIYGAAATFPVNAGNTNYWTDVIFSPSSYTFTLTGITDGAGCISTGTPLQTLNVTSADCSTLPVSLINFSATPNDNSVLLRWATASEINNLGFELQRSIDGNNGWSAITFVSGAGNSNSTRNYTYVDENLSARRYYYRLKQIDADAKYYLSAVRSVQINDKWKINIYPNPVTGNVLQLTSNAQLKTIIISDVYGRTLLRRTASDITNADRVNIAGYAAGLYFIQVSNDENKVLRTSFIKY